MLENNSPDENTHNSQLQPEHAFINKEMVQEHMKECAECSNYYEGLKQNAILDTLTENQFVYYNPWDEQYVTYLTLEYTDTAYTEELERLSSIGID